MAYNELERAILTTLHYSALFDYPLTKAELWQFLLPISSAAIKTIDQKMFTSSLVSLEKKKQICLQDGYYALYGKEDTIALRKTRLLAAQQKLPIVQKIASKLAKIPTIYLIGISGGLAMENADDGDDIDLFIITKKNTLFITRLLILSLLQINGLRRKRIEYNPRNKFCVNLLIDETAFAWNANQRDIFIAHEIAQLKPVFDRNNTYHRFLSENQWIRDYLPNSLSNRNQKLGLKNYRLGELLISLHFIELFAKKLQLLLIRHHQTAEQITPTRLAFHPHNYRSNFIRKLNLNLAKAGLLTKI